MPVQKHAYAGGDGPQKPMVESEYDPFDTKRIYNEPSMPEERRVA
jgi:hypothetical protein